MSSIFPFLFGVLFLFIITIILLNMFSYIGYINFLLSDAILFTLLKLSWKNAFPQAFIFSLFFPTCFYSNKIDRFLTHMNISLNSSLALPKSFIFVVVIQNYCSSACWVQMICCYYCFSVQEYPLVYINCGSFGQKLNLSFVLLCFTNYIETSYKIPH